MRESGLFFFMAIAVMPRREASGWVDLAKKVSPSMAITGMALAFAYFLMTTVTQKLDAHAAETRELLYIARLTCENTAKTDAAANRCWSGWQGAK